MKYSSLSWGRTEAVINIIGGTKGVTQLLAGKLEVRERIPASTYLLPMPLISPSSLFVADAWVSAFNRMAKRAGEAEFGLYLGKETAIEVSIDDLYFSKEFAEGAFCGFEKCKKYLAPFGELDERIVDSKRGDEYQLLAKLGEDMDVYIYEFRDAISFSFGATSLDSVSLRHGDFAHPKVWHTTVEELLKFLKAVECCLTGCGRTYECRAFITVRFTSSALPYSLELRTYLEDRIRILDMLPEDSVLKPPIMECSITNFF